MERFAANCPRFIISYVLFVAELLAREVSDAGAVGGVGCGVVRVRSGRSCGAARLALCYASRVARALYTTVMRTTVASESATYATGNYYKLATRPGFARVQC
jgi:hypothetical protein